MLTPVEEPLKDEDRAYLAAIIDAKGSLCIKKGTRGRYKVTLKIEGLTTDLAAWINGLFMRRRPQKMTPVAGGNYVSFETRLALRALSSCFYFLRVKKEKARVALEFGQTLPGNGRRLSESDLIRQAEMAARLSDLNHK